ncbi:MAG: CvpA family protein [Lachnospiraceae bacterium]|nr:CvpA family protein [Lachnospiraceae bacterium]
MDMNWLALAVAVLFAGFIIYGWVKGFFRLVISFAGTIIILIAVVIVSPQVSRYIINHTGIYENTEKKVVSVFLEKLYSVEGSEEEGDNTEDGDGSVVPGDTINDLDIPEIFKNDLIEKNASEMYQALLATVFKEFIAGYIARLIINAGSFVGVYVAFWLALKILLKSSDLLAKLPVIRKLNKFLGALVGGAEALIIVWIVFFIIIMFLGNELGGKLLKAVQDSVFLSYLFNNNLLFRFIS